VATCSEGWTIDVYTEDVVPSEASDGLTWSGPAEAAVETGPSLKHGAALTLAGLPRARSVPRGPIVQAHLAFSQEVPLLPDGLRVEPETLGGRLDRPVALT
jgi:hypothetical protein